MRLLAGKREYTGNINRCFHPAASAMAQFLPLQYIQILVMKKLFIPIVALLAVACNNDDKDKDSVEMAKEQNQVLDSSKSNAPDTLAADHNFLVEAASGGMMEVQLGKYAVANAGSAAVKQFGQMMVNDHTKGDSEATVIANVKAIAIPGVPGDKHQKHIDDLTKKKGAEFDKDYMSMMVDDHEEDIRKFEDEAKNGKDPDIRAFASQTLPVLRKHLDAAKKIKKGLK
jgi:putative membrane protein